MRINFLGIEAFLSIADRGSFKGAATHLNLSQTALSHRLRKLEAELGLRLFARTTRKVLLTPAGAELLPRAGAMLEELGAACENLKAQGRQKRETLSIGCLPTIATSHLPKLLDAFSQRLPDVAVRVYDNSAAEIADLVERGEAEFGITVLSAGRWDLEMQPLAKERYVLLCPQDHPLARRSTVVWSDFENEPLVRVSAQTANRAIIDSALGARGERLKWRYEVQHIATAAGLVADHVALTIAPQLSLNAAFSPGLVALPIRNPSITRTLGIVSRCNVPMSDAAAILLALVKRRFRESRED
ncbi:LysR family transcriptional regulator [Methylocella silvestris]|uniref:LysR family transcriptional regulator n=1 Tax=Methylocella silvestris TaxID=199596 RepID=A0A2J7TCS3_METSI|nr:LysR family transcriptional regulator [Methylocella silvestris]PNG24568.1 LysR family transcriptional regulator [Methylocella silvestris]